jgi:hypothetical protein
MAQVIEKIKILLIKQLIEQQKDIKESKGCKEKLVTIIL